MRPEDVAAATRDLQDPAGDAADQAERLTMIMEAEAALADGDREDPVPAYPVDDPDRLVSDEDAQDDASDDPLHHGGPDPADLRRSSPPAEEAAMHVVDGDGIDRSYLTEEPAPALTAEDATLLGIDPYPS